MKTNRFSITCFLATLPFLAQALHAGSACCAPKEEIAPKPAASCCSTVEPAAFSRDSIFQLEGAFVNDHGETVSLASLRGRPVVLAMFFARCGYACPLLLSDMAQIHARIPPSQRKEVALVLVSFDPKRDTPEALREFRVTRELGAEWILLTANNDSVTELAAVLGVKYTLQSDGQYAHSNLLTVLNREGEIIHQRNGLRGGHEAVLAALDHSCR